jgi:S-DNA-T family DNA segregation ATPase FtsK/SpoIIIE
LGETPPPASSFPTWIGVLLAILLGAGAMFGVFKLLRQETTSASKKIMHSPIAIMQIKSGPDTGKSFPLYKLPCRIGRDSLNEICLDDPFVTGQHAKIFAANNNYYLMDLGGETFINGMAIRKNSAVLKPGDTVRLGRNIFFTFTV